MRRCRRCAGAVFWSTSATRVVKGRPLPCPTCTGRGARSSAPRWAAPPSSGHCSTMSMAAGGDRWWTASMPLDDIDAAARRLLAPDRFGKSCCASPIRPEPLQSALSPSRPWRSRPPASSTLLPNRRDGRSVAHDRLFDPVTHVAGELGSPSAANRVIGASVVCVGDGSAARFRAGHAGVGQALRSEPR
jgi:hypothetical protein